MHALYTPPSGQTSWLSLIGPDAQDFLHRVSTADARNLRPGEGARACILSAQGKLRAYFSLWNYRPGEYALELDSRPPLLSPSWKDSLLKALDELTFAEKMTLADVSSLSASWLFPEPAKEAELLEQLGAPGLSPFQTVANHEEIRLCHQGSADFGRPWISIWGRPERVRQWLDRVLPDASHLQEQDLENLRIQALRPRLGVELFPDTIPLEAGLIDAIAQHKGCYPGQEVIERITSLGAPARRLCLIQGNLGTDAVKPTIGTSITNEADPAAVLGEITSIVPAADGFLALAYLRKIHAKEGLSVRFAGSLAHGKVQRIAPYEASSSEMPE